MCCTLDLQAGRVVTFRPFAARTGFPATGRGGVEIMTVSKGIEIRCGFLPGMMVNVQFRRGKSYADKEESNG